MVHEKVLSKLNRVYNKRTVPNRSSKIFKHQRRLHITVTSPHAKLIGARSPLSCIFVYKVVYGDKSDVIDFLHTEISLLIISKLCLTLDQNLNLKIQVTKNNNKNSRYFSGEIRKLKSLKKKIIQGSHWYITSTRSVLINGRKKKKKICQTTLLQFVLARPTSFKKIFFLLAFEWI